MIFTKHIGFNDSVDWNALIEKSKTATFFQTKEWLKLWLKHFPGEELILGIYDDDELIGIAPLLKRETSVQFLGVADVLGDNKVSDYGDIIAKTSYEEIVWKEVLAKIKNEMVELNYIREDSPSLGILREIGGNKIKVEAVDVAPYLDLPKIWEEYLSGLDRHNRHELRRKIRKIEDAGATTVVYQGEKELIEAFFRLMALSKEEKKAFLSEKMKAFFQELIEFFWKKGKLNLSFLKLDGELIAATLSFYFHDSVLLYNSGFNPAHSFLSVGLVTKASLIRDSIEKGKKVFDFLRGDEKYKYDLGGKERKLYRVLFS